MIAAWIGVALIAWVAVPGWAAPANLAPSPAAVRTGDTWTFSYTGSPEQFTVPPGVTTITITAVGGSGEVIDKGAGPGNGAMTLSSFTVTPGDVLTVWVGGVGIPAGGWGFGCGGERGDASFGSYPGIGNGGGGGGSSAVTLGGTNLDPTDACNPAARPDLSQILTVAGGGGAGGGNGAVVTYTRGNGMYLYVDGGAGGAGGVPATAGQPASTAPTAGGCGGCQRSPNGGAGGEETIGAQLSGSGGGGGGAPDGGGGGGGTPRPLGGAAGGGGGGGQSYTAPSAQVGFNFYQGGRGQQGWVTLIAGQLDLYQCTQAMVTTQPPADLPVLSIVAQGAQGNVRSDGFAAPGGAGGVVGASYTLTSDIPVEVWVGCQDGGWGWGSGGAKGDGKATTAYDGTNGGGSSAVFLGTGIGVVAGGGGGGGGQDDNHDDADGVGGSGGQPATGGHSGGSQFDTHAAGGCGGCNNFTDGSNGTSSPAIELGGGGGGGGGGFLSGGGGRTKDSTNGGGGGGGTSWASDGTANVSFSTAVGEGDGSVQLFWTAGPGAAISTYGGDRQVAFPGTQFTEPLQALVIDSTGSPSTGMDVIFDLTPGGNAGAFAGQQGQVVTVQTDASGIATSPPIVAGPPAKGWPASAQVDATGKVTWFSLTNQGFSSAVSLGVAPRPVTPNQDTGIEATVTGGTNVTSVPTGDIVFVVQGAEHVVPLTGGRAFLDLPPGTLTVGSSGVSASYPGDDVFEPNNASLPLDVVPTTTSVAVVSSANPSTTGQGVIFTANVSVATGNQQCADCLVTFAADGVTLGTSAVGFAGTAAFGPVTSLSPGSHTITASFAGGAGYLSSSGSMVQQVSGPVAVSVSTSPAPSEKIAAFDISVSVVSSGGPEPTGSVTIGAGGNLYCVNQALVGGEYTCHLDSYTTQFFPLGSLPITASYGGDDHYAPAAGASTQSIVPGATSASVVPSAQTIVAGSPVSFTVTVTAPVQSLVKPFGNIELLADGLPVPGLESVEIDGGQVTTPAVQIPGDGLHTITANYLPVSLWTASSGSTQLAVLPAATAVQVVPLAEKTLLGEAPTFVAEVTVAGQAIEPAGSVQFRVNGIDRGAPVPLVDGRAVSAPIANLPAGDHDVSARFLPAEGLLAGAARRTHTISQPTVVMVGSLANPSRPRKRVTFRAHVGPMAPGGTLSFAIDGRRIRGCQNVPVVHSTAECRLRKPRRGKRVVTVAYSGTHGYEPSTATFGQIVKPRRSKR